MSDDKKDRGWEFLYSEDEEGSFSEDDGSWGYTHSNSSGSYHGADGSYGYKYADGSASYYGSDGSWGYRNADGSISYYGADGAWGYKNSDGSSSYYNGSESNQYFDSNDCDDYHYDDDDDSDSSDSGNLADVFVGLFAVAIVAGLASHFKKKQQKREADTTRYAEAEQIRLEKKKERKVKNALRKQRAKAFLFKRKKIEIHYDYGELVDRNIEFVTRVLTEDAFTNIKSVSVKDIYTNSPYEVGQVDQVVIDGIGSFQEGDQIPYDAEIVITYHEKREITIPFSERSLRKLNYVEAGDTLQELGFTEIYIHPLRDLVTGWAKKDGAVKKVAVGDIYPFKKNSAFAYDTKIVIEYHTFKEK